MTYNERLEITKAMRKAGFGKPKKEELKLKRLLGPYGFMSNIKAEINPIVSFGGYSNILSRVRSIYPDLIHPAIPIVIENDGWQGHSPDSFWVKKHLKELKARGISTTQADMDKERDAIYRANDVFVIKVYPEDHCKKDEDLVEMILGDIESLGFLIDKQKYIITYSEECCR